MEYNDESTEPFIDPDYRTVSCMLKKYEGSDELILDGILATVGDYKKVATEWLGTTITLVEMDPSENQVKQLAQWPGKTINLHVCGHVQYDLTRFFNGINNWNGDKVTIAYCSGKELFKIETVGSLKNPKYKQLCFNKCGVPQEYVNQIKNTVPGLKITIT